MKVFCWFRDPVVVELGISTHLSKRTTISQHISSLQSYIICTHCLTQFWLYTLLMQVNNCSNIFYWVVLTQQNDMWNTRSNCKVGDALTHVVKHVPQTLCEKPVGSFENWGSHSQVVVLVPVQSLRPSTWKGDLKKTRLGMFWLLHSVCSNREIHGWTTDRNVKTEPTVAVWPSFGEPEPWSYLSQNTTTQHSALRPHCIFLIFMNNFDVLLDSLRICGRALTEIRLQSSISTSMPVRLNVLSKSSEVIAGAWRIKEWQNFIRELDANLTFCRRRNCHQNRHWYRYLPRPWPLILWRRRDLVTKCQWPQPGFKHGIWWDWHLIHIAFA